MLTPDSDYRDVLRFELERRCQADPHYSLRAFARDLGLAPSRLSEVFNRKQGLSRSVAERIARVIGLSQKETAIFVDLVEMEHGRSQEKRTLAKIRLQERAIDLEFGKLQIDAFKVVSDWYHFAILQTLECENMSDDPRALAGVLGISPAQAKAAVERLLRLDILVRGEDGRLRPADEFIAVGDDIPSESIRKFHKQVLEKALKAIDLQPMSNRNISANFVAIDKKDLPRAFEMMKRFRRRFAKEISPKEGNKNSVYCLSMQFFEITKGLV